MNEKESNLNVPFTMVSPSRGPTRAAWFERNLLLFEEERRTLTAAHPGMSLAIRPAGYYAVLNKRLLTRGVLAEGKIAVQTDPGGAGTRSYEVTALLPEDYPDVLPTLYCRDPKIPRELDRHVLPDYSACLCVPSELRRFVPFGSSLARWFDRLVVPFLFGQYCFYRDGFWPWKDRAHGGAGIFQAYAECFGTEDLATIVKLLRVFLGDDIQPRRSLCPCGSGQRYKDCHENTLQQLRPTIPSQVAAQNLRILQTR